MSQIQQMLGRQLRATTVVEREEVPLRDDFLRTRQVAVEDQGRRMRSDRLEQAQTVAAFGGGQDDPGRIVLHQRRQHFLLALGRFAGAAEQSDEARACKRLVDARGELREERIRQIVDHHRDARRPAAAQVACRTVVDIALLAQLLLDARAGGCGNQRTAMQHQRNRSGRYAGGGCDVGKSDPAALHRPTLTPSRNPDRCITAPSI